MPNESAQQTDHTVERRTPFRLWWDWTFSCGVGEFVGMNVAAGTAAIFIMFFGEPETLSARIACLLVMILAGVLEGTSIGFFQWRVLQRVFPDLSLRTWLTPTIIVAAVGWLVGMLPQTFLGNAEGGEAIPEPSPLMILILAAVFGGVAGVVFGFAQWFVLRRRIEHATVWIWMNATGWALAMVLIYCGASLPSTEWPMMFVIVTGGVTGIVAGLAIGGVTGGGLVWLLRDHYGSLAQVLLLRMLHFVFATIFLICLIHVYACGLLGRLTPWVLLSISLLAVEGVVLLFNRGDCPLSALQRKLGDNRGFFGLFLPAWTLPFVVPLFGLLTLIGFGWLFVAFLRA